MTSILSPRVVVIRLPSAWSRQPLCVRSFAVTAVRASGEGESSSRVRASSRNAPSNDAAARAFSLAASSFAFERSTALTRSARSSPGSAPGSAPIRR